MKNILLYFYTLLFMGSIAEAKGVSAAFEMRGHLGLQQQHELQINTEKLNTLVERLKSEGWKVSVNINAAESDVLYEKSKEESLSEIIVHKLKGCKYFDENCQLRVRNLNRNIIEAYDFDSEGRVVGFLEASDFVAKIQNYEGELYLPAVAIDFEVSIDAGNNYRVEEHDKYTSTTYVSKKLYELTQSIAYMRTDTTAVATKLYPGPVGVVFENKLVIE